MKLKASLVLPAILLLSTNASAADDLAEAGGKAAEMAKNEKCETVCEEVKDPSEWEKSLAFGFSLTDGNSNTSLLNLSAKLFRDYESNIWSFEANGSYGESEVENDAGEVIEETTQEDFKFDSSYKRSFENNMYVGFTNQFLYDDVAGIDYRVTLFPHLGYFLIKDEALEVSVEAGPGYVFEKLDGVKNDYLAPRVGEEIKWQISENAKFFEKASYTFDVDDSDNYLVEAEVGIEAAISSVLSLVFSVKDLYDNVPTAGRERNDVSIVTALQVAL